MMVKLTGTYKLLFKVEDILGRNGHYLLCFMMLYDASLVFNYTNTIHLYAASQENRSFEFLMRFNTK